MLGRRTVTLIANIGRRVCARLVINETFVQPIQELLRCIEHHQGDGKKLILNYTKSTGGSISTAYSLKII